MALNNPTDQILGNTKSLTHSFGGFGTEEPAAQPEAPAIPTTGPTGFWQRVTSVGVGKVNALNAYQLAQRNVKAAGKAVASDFVNIAKEANKNLIQPIVKPEEHRGPGAGNILQAQADAQAAVKSGKVSPEAIKALGQIQGSKDHLFALKTVADPSLSKEQVQEKLLPIIQKQSDQTKKMLAAALELSSLAVGGEEGKALLTGGKAAIKPLIKAGVVNTIAGTTGNVGSTLLNKPNATRKELQSSANTGAEFGIATTLLGALGGKVAEDVKTIIGKNPEVNSLLKNTASSQLLKKGEEANKPVKIDVQSTETGAEKVGVKTPVRPGIRQESELDKINVRTPTRPGIKEVSETSRINVRTPDQMSEKEYVKQLTKISKNYEESSAKLQGLAPEIQKAKQEAIDSQHQKLVEELNDNFNKPSLTNPRAPQKIESKVIPAGKTTGGAPKQTFKKISSEVSKAEPTTGGLPKESKTATQKLTGKPVVKEVGTTTTPKTTTPKPVVNADGTAISGSALKDEAKAIEAELTDRYEGKATYKPESYKKEFEDAPKLVHEDPQKAMDIAMGRTPANNDVHGVAVYSAVRNKAIREADSETMRQLVSSPYHSEGSEAGQKLGARGYATLQNDPVVNMKTVADARVAAVEKRTGTPVAKAIEKDVKTAETHFKAPSKSEWSMFVESLKC